MASTYRPEPDAALNAHTRLAQEWPRVEVGLRRVLRARQVSPDDADDFMQEVAVRIIREDVIFASAEDLLPWATTVVRNLHVSATRLHCNRKRSEWPADVPSRTPDVADIVHWRIALSQTLAELDGLSEAKRASIVGHLDGQVTGREAGRVAVMRHRARQDLRKALPGIIGAVAAVAGRLRRPLTTGGTMVATACVAVWALLPPEASLAVPDAGPSEVIRPAVTQARETPAASSTREQTETRAPRRAPRMVTSTAPPPNVLLDPLPGSGVFVEQEERQGPQPLVCLDDFPVVEHLCTPVIEGATKAKAPIGPATPTI